MELNEDPKNWLSKVEKEKISLEQRYMKDLELYGGKIELTSWLKSKMASSTLSYQAGLKVLPKLKLHE